jgi:hypothetical protein
LSTIVKWIDSDGDLNGTLPWKRAGRDWVFKGFHSGLYEQPIRLDDGPSSLARPFYIEIGAVLHEPPQPNLAPEYAEKTPFASGRVAELGQETVVEAAAVATCRRSDGHRLRW